MTSFPFPVTPQSESSESSESSEPHSTQFDFSQLEAKTITKKEIIKIIKYYERKLNTSLQERALHQLVAIYAYLPYYFTNYQNVSLNGHIGTYEYERQRYIASKGTGYLTSDLPIIKGQTIKILFRREFKRGESIKIGVTTNPWLANRPQSEFAEYVTVSRRGHSRYNTFSIDDDNVS